jgi:hypothetical protein
MMSANTLSDDIIPPRNTTHPRMPPKRESSAAIKLTLKGSGYELVFFETLVYLNPSINFCNALFPGHSSS